jgi:hypothetical protein
VPIWDGQSADAITNAAEAYDPDGDDGGLLDAEVAESLYYNDAVGEKIAKAQEREARVHTLGVLQKLQSLIKVQHDFTVLLILFCL